MRTVLESDATLCKLQISAVPHRALLIHFDVLEWSNLVMSVQQVSADSIIITDNVLLKGTRIPRNEQVLYKHQWHQDKRIMFLPPPTSNIKTYEFVIAPRPDQIVPPELLDGVDVNADSINVTLLIQSASVSCLFWDETIEEWASDGCQVSNFTTLDTIHCRCDHMTAFSGSFLKTFVKVDSQSVLSILLFSVLYGSPVILSTLLIVWVMYIPILYWAVKKDQLLPKESVSRLADNHPADHYQYFVALLEGQRMIASAPSRLFIKIYGSEGSSATHLLYNSYVLRSKTGKDSGWFVVTTPFDLGDLHYIRVWLDMEAEQPEWFLREVVIKDMQKKMMWHFVYNDWLGMKTSSQSPTTVEIRATPEEQATWWKFSTKVWRDFYHKHMWLGIFSNISNTSFTYVQRAVCTFIFILGSMTVSIFLLGIPQEYVPNDSDASEIVMTSEPILIGVQCGTIVFIVDLILLFLFTAAKPKLPSRNITEYFQKRHILRYCSLHSVCDKLGDREIATQTNISSITEDFRGSKYSVNSLTLLQNESDSSSDEDKHLFSTHMKWRKLFFPKSQRKKRYNLKRGKKSNMCEQNIRWPCSVENIHDSHHPVTKTRVSLSCISLSGTLESSNYQPTFHINDPESHCDTSNKPDFHLNENVNCDFDARNMLPRSFQKTSEKQDTADTGQPHCLKSLDKYAEKMRLQRHGHVGQLNITRWPHQSQFCKLPWWSVIVAWILIIGVCFVSTFLILLNGIKYSQQESINWLFTLAVALLHSFVILEPLKVIVMVTVTGNTSAHIIYRRFINLHADLREHHQYYLKLKSLGLHLTPPSMWIKSLISPLNSEAVKRVNALWILSKKNKKAAKDIILYAALLLILLMIAFGDKDVVNHFRANHATENIFVNDGYKGNIALSKVKTIEDIFVYLRTNLVANLFTDREYGCTTSNVYCLISKVRIRQKRVKPGTCEHDTTIKDMMREFRCRVPFSGSVEDRATYNGSWKLPGNKEGPVTEWTFQSNGNL